MALVQKLSISVSREELDWAKERARSLGLSLSAVVSEALLRQRQAEAGVRLLEELGTDDITEEDLAAMRAELGWAPARKASPRRRSRGGRRGA